MAKSKLENYLFPPRCIFCGAVIETNKTVCNECLNSVIYLSMNTCERCGYETEHCNCKVGDFAFKRNIGIFYYKGGIKKTIFRLKYYDFPQVAGTMSEFMSERIGVKYKDITFDFVTFVPTSPLKTAYYGYDRMQLIAKKISEKLELPLIPTMRRKVLSFDQKYKTAKQRRENIKGKFKPITNVKAKNVLLVDDVMTTGSTLSECARVLKRMGVKQVFCVTFAITLKNN